MRRCAPTIAYILSLVDDVEALHAFEELHQHGRIEVMRQLKEDLRLWVDKAVTESIRKCLNKKHNTLELIKFISTKAFLKSLE